MNDDFNYNNENQPIIVDENEVKQFLEEKRKRKEKERLKEQEKYERIQRYIFIVIFILSIIIQIAYEMILDKYYDFRVDIHKVPFYMANSSILKECGENVMIMYGFFEYASFYIVRIIPSRIVCIILTSAECYFLIWMEKILFFDELLYFKDVPIVFWLFILYCILIIGCFIFGVFSLYYKNMYEYIMKDPPLHPKVPFERRYK